MSFLVRRSMSTAGGHQALKALRKIRMMRSFASERQPLNSSNNVPKAELNEGPSPQSLDDYLHGQVLDLAVDLQTVRPGDRLEIPYELTVSESMQDFWQSVSLGLKR
jgi:hypothetical protein